MKAKNYLLTGATGFIGSYLLEELLKTAHVGTIYVLCRNVDAGDDRRRLVEAFDKFSVHAARDLASVPGIRVLEGDIVKPRLGLSPAHYDEVCREVDVIHHIAARVNHIRPLDVLKAPNVDSVADVIGIAKTGKPKVVNFVSTLGSAVRVDADGMYVEDFPDQHTPLQSDMGYLLSKWEAEKLLGKFHEEGGRTNLFRLGYISGHARTGAALFADNQFMLLIKSCVQLGYAPMMKRTINLTPVDFTAEVMNLPQYAETGGHVLNLFNYTELIEWHEIVEWLNDRGYPVQDTGFYDWQRHLLAAGEHNALHRFLPLYGQPGAHDKIIRFGREIGRFRTEKVRQAVESGGMRVPKLKFELLDRYLAYLQAQGFLPEPQAPHGAPAQRTRDMAGQ